MGAMVMMRPSFHGGPISQGDGVSHQEFALFFLDIISRKSGDGPSWQRTMKVESDFRQCFPSLQGGQFLGRGQQTFFDAKLCPSYRQGQNPWLPRH